MAVREPFSKLDEEQVRQKRDELYKSGKVPEAVLFYKLAAALVEAEAAPHWNVAAAFSELGVPGDEIMPPSSEGNVQIWNFEEAKGFLNRVPQTPDILHNICSGKIVGKSTPTTIRGFEDPQDKGKYATPRAIDFTLYC